VPLFIVNVAFTLVHAPLEENVTGRPELAVAATVKLELNAAVAGAGVVTVIVWLALLTVSVVPESLIPLKVDPPLYVYAIG
jgi:hypothetical protein